MKKIKINHFGVERVFNVLDEYKQRLIVTEENDTTIQVYNPDKNTLFIVCMDDSKSCGYRTFDEYCNNLDSAKEYIDWCVSLKGLHN